MDDDYKIGDLFKSSYSPNPDWDQAILLLLKIDKELYNGEYICRCFFNDGFIADHQFAKLDMKKIC